MTSDSKLGGILLHGLSGTGKTHIIHAVAYSSGLPVIEITVSKNYNFSFCCLNKVFKSKADSGWFWLWVTQVNRCVCLNGRSV